MNRLIERIVSNGCAAARAFAAGPTTTSPLGSNDTADGRRNSPVSGFGRHRGPSASSRATRLFVVPRSMPTTRAISDSERLVDVVDERCQVGDLREAPLEIREHGRRRRIGRVPRAIALLERALEVAAPALEVLVRPLDGGAVGTARAKLRE